MKKILFLIHLPPPIHGASMVNNYIYHSKKLNSVFQTHYINITTASGNDDIGIFRLNKLWRIVYLLKSVFTKVREAQPDLVYITLTASGLGFYKDALLALLAKKMNCKVVFHHHNKGFQKQMAKSSIKKWFYKWVFDGVYSIHLSESLLYDLEGLVPQERQHVVQNGSPMTVEQIDRNIQEQKPKVNILYLSNLQEEKGVFVLLEAIGLLMEQSTKKFCVDFVGKWENEETEYLFNQKVKQLKIESVVNYLGAKYDKDKHEVFMNADIFVLPTYYRNECFPLSILEAMQYQLAIISTTEGAIPDIIQHEYTGLIAERKSSESLVNEIRKMISDNTLRESLGAQARATYIEKYTMESFENRLSHCLGQLV